MVVTVDKRRHPLEALIFASKWPSLVIRPVLRCAEQLIGVMVVIADALPHKRPENAQLFQPPFLLRSMHGIVVVSVEDQRLAALLADPLSIKPCSLDRLLMLASNAHPHLRPLLSGSRHRSSDRARTTSHARLWAGR